MSDYCGTLQTLGSKALTEVDDRFKEEGKNSVTDWGNAG